MSSSRESFFNLSRRAGLVRVKISSFMHLYRVLPILQHRTFCLCQLQVQREMIMASHSCFKSFFFSVFGWIFCYRSCVLFLARWSFSFFVARVFKRETNDFSSGSRRFFVDNKRISSLNSAWLIGQCRDLHTSSAMRFHWQYWNLPRFGWFKMSRLKNYSKKSELWET